MSQDHRTGIILISVLGAAALTLALLIGRTLIVETDPISTESKDPSSPSDGITIFKDFFGSIPETPPPARSMDKSVQSAIRHLNDEGLALYNQENYKEAANRFREGLKQKPQSSVLRQNLAYAMGNLAWQQIETGQNHEALLNFQEALNLDVEDASFYTGMGLIYHRLKEDNRAIEMLKSAISQGARNAQPYRLLGEIYYLYDEMDLAVGYLERALELDPRDANLKTRLTKARREQKTQGDFLQQNSLHFTVKFEGGEEYEAARKITILLEEAYVKIGQFLLTYPQGPVTVILYSDQQFRDVTLSPSWSKGIFDGKIRLPIENFDQDQRILRKVIHHEYTHAVVYELCKVKIPTWLNEGIALNFEGSNPEGWKMILVNWIRKGRPLVPLQHLHDSFMTLKSERASLAYAESYSAVRYLIDRYGRFRIKDLLVALNEDPNFEDTFEEQFLISYQDFEREWHRQTKRHVGQDT